MDGLSPSRGEIFEGMKAMRIIVCVTPLLVFGGISAQAAPSASQMSAWPEVAQLTPHATCFKSGEEISGMNRICYYNCMGSTAAITISVGKLCPLTIRQ